MNKIITTTALALIISSPVFAQDGFYSEMDQNDILASELIGSDVYAPATRGDATTRDAAAGDTRTQMDAERLANLENIGEVAEIVLGRDGQVRAVIVNVGTFLGMGGREVAIEMNQFDFVMDAQDATHMYVVTNVGADSLENSPEFTRMTAEDQRTEGMAQGDRPAGADADRPVGIDTTQAQQQEMDRQQMDRQQMDRQQSAWRSRDPFAPPQMEREGYQTAPPGEVSVDNLVGATVYDPEDSNIGNVTDIVIDAESGEFQYAVIDVGGFLGFGTHSVAIGLDEMTILHDSGWADLRVYVNVNQETLESMPEYTATR